MVRSEVRKRCFAYFFVFVGFALLLLIVNNPIILMGFFDYE